jgi:hypothetical protein
MQSTQAHCGSGLKRYTPSIHKYTHALSFLGVTGLFAVVITFHHVQPLGGTFAFVCLVCVVRAAQPGAACAAALLSARSPNSCVTSPALSLGVALSTIRERFPRSSVSKWVADSSPAVHSRTVSHIHSRWLHFTPPAYAKAGSRTQRILWSAVPSGHFTKVVGVQVNLTHGSRRSYQRCH